MLDITIDDKLNFNSQINKNFRKSANQLNALPRLKHFLGNEEKKSLNKQFCYFKFQLLPFDLDVRKCNICP